MNNLGIFSKFLTITFFLVIGVAYVSFSRYCLAAESGSLRWSYTSKDGIDSSPSIGVDGTIYVGSEDDTLYALNPDGSLQWSYPTGGDIDSSPSIGVDGTIYVGSEDDTLYALNPDGSLQWSYPTGGDIDSSPSIGVDGTIYVASEDDTLYAFNPDGSLQWNSKLGGSVESSPAIGSDGTIYLCVNVINMLSCNSKIYALTPAGNLKWTYMTKGLIVASPSVGRDGTIYIGSDDHKLYAITADGDLKWTYGTKGWIVSSPSVGRDGTIYIGSDDHKLYAITADGNLKWSYETGRAIESSSVVGTDGTIYVGSEDWKLYAINGNSGGLANSSWPMFGHDLRHSGNVQEDSKNINIVSLWQVENAVTGSRSKLWAQVKNNQYASLESDIRVWFYVTSLDWTGSHWVGAYDVSGLDSGASTWGSCDWAVPSSATPGVYSYWAQVWNDEVPLSDWSERQDFVVAGEKKPSAAVLLSPKGTLGESPSTFIWNTVKDSSWYQLWIGTASEKIFSKWYRMDEVYDSESGTCVVNPELSLSSGEYTWCVQTWNVNGLGPWSSGKSFVVTAE